MIDGHGRVTSGQIYECLFHMTASLTTVETKCFPTLIVSMKMLILFGLIVRFVSVTASHVVNTLTRSKLCYMAIQASVTYMLKAVFRDRLTSFLLYLFLKVFISKQTNIRVFNG